ncbi:MAG: ribbon-helix-helix protein, CopG family [Lentisphaeraceae bacterium]|nr:ribbon-helix-helix protein, CopG family [Lentisphaeraceae bacterium]
MKTIQMTLDEALLEELDSLTRKLKVNRSAFTREALRREIRRQEDLELEEKHRLGYEKLPVTPEEFMVADEHRDIPGADEW